MTVISQDGLTAIDSKEIQYYFIVVGNAQNTLMAMPHNRTPEIRWNVLKIFSDKNLNVVKRVMRFLIHYANTCQDKISLEVDLTRINFYEYPKTMKCSYCNTFVKSGNFCANCGKKLKRFCDCWVVGATHSCGQTECPGLKERNRVSEKIKNLA